MSTGQLPITTDTIDSSSERHRSSGLRQRLFTRIGREVSNGSTRTAHLSIQGSHRTRMVSLVHAICSWRRYAGFPFRDPRRSISPCVAHLNAPRMARFQLCRTRVLLGSGRANSVALFPAAGPLSPIRRAPEAARADVAPHCALSGSVALPICGAENGQRASGNSVPFELRTERYKLPSRYLRVGTFAL
jgi:hypothetical protein